ncbi:hypothetical protein BV898_14068 [Hypsibius exemplaris]|uniref:Protein sleepless n=1 Tax=Hypsibius exemplaris TaxID=2072580 RepID=A0A1W0W8W7_HYPEX|nr:hypothetical protein BV898_14068 [Hypsibius exemplaris]
MKTPWPNLLLFLAVTVCVFLTGTSAFSCYACKNGDACDDVTEQMKTDCTSPLGAINTCIKAKVSGNVIRSCGVPGTNLNKCAFDSGVAVCMCESDLCNGTPPRVSPSLHASLAASLGVFILQRLV